VLGKLEISCKYSSISILLPFLFILAFSHIVKRLLLYHKAFLILLYINLQKWKGTEAMRHISLVAAYLEGKLEKFVYKNLQLRGKGLYRFIEMGILMNLEVNL